MDSRPLANLGAPTRTLPIGLVIVLQPSASSEQVTVSAARTEVRLSETPGSTVLLSNTDVAATPALRVDDVLRQVPGFSLFRRSDSRTANASNQGVSLRGLGGTAASRALVLEDGLPLVDAFGGWVYWDRVPRASHRERGSIPRRRIEPLRQRCPRGSRAVHHPPAARCPPSRWRLRTAANGLPTFLSGPELAPASGTCRSHQKCSAPMATSSFPHGSAARVDTPANSEDAAVELTVGHQIGEKGRSLWARQFLSPNSATTARRSRPTTRAWAKALSDWISSSAQ